MAILTKYNLAKKLALETLKRHFPVGPGWFSEAALEAEGELYKLLDFVAGGHATFVESVSDAKQGTFLLSATGEDADDWGQDLEIERLDEDEEDADYTQRMQDTLLAETCTDAGIIATIASTTGLTTKLFKPWEHIDIRGQRNPYSNDAIDPVYGRSGSRVRISEYYTGGVLDIITHGFSPKTEAIAKQVVSAGVKLYFTAIFQFPLLTAPATTPKFGGVRYHLVYLPYIPFGVRSGEVPLGGAQVARYVRGIHKSFEHGIHYNQLLWSSVLTFHNLAGYTWDQALAGPIYVLPSPTFTQTDAPE